MRVKEVSTVVLDGSLFSFFFYYFFISFGHATWDGGLSSMTRDMLSHPVMSDPL